MLGRKECARWDIMSTLVTVKICTHILGFGLLSTCLTAGMSFVFLKSRVTAVSVGRSVNNLWVEINQYDVMGKGVSS